MAHEVPVRFKDGLVDPADLLGFLQGCRCEELGWSCGHKPEFHHIYFPRTQYKREPDRVVGMLRNSNLNLVEMLSCQEEQYHRSRGEIVPIELIDREAASKFMEEARVLTQYSALSYLKAEVEIVARHPKVSRSARMSSMARMALLEEMQRKEGEKIGEFEVIDRLIVVGSLSKYLAQQREPELESLVQALQLEDRTMIPTKIYSGRALRNFAEPKLARKIQEQRYTVRNLFLSPASEVSGFTQ